MEARRPMVLVVQEWVPQYREAFFNQLRHELDLRNIELQLVHGQPPDTRVERADSVAIPWARPIRNRTLNIGGFRLTWQPALTLCRKADLVVVPQDVALVLGPVLLVAARLGLFPPIALWGHGENIHSSNRFDRAEQVKRRLSLWAHWFFAYTEFSATKVMAAGFPGNRITAVNNSRSSAPVAPEDRTADDIASLVREVSHRTSNIGWMISALDETKRLDVLIEAADEVRRLVPDFEFFVVGAGPGESIVRSAAATRPWLHVVGSRFGADRQAIGDIAQITLHPGLIGLHVIDSFNFRAPIVTADIPDHSHEVTYLEDGVNARVLESGSSPVSLGRAAAEVLTNVELSLVLQTGCAAGAEIYSLSSMVERFAQGVERAMAEPR